MDSLDLAWEKLKEELVALQAQAANTARLGLTKALNQSIRRLRQYEGESEWFSAVMDAFAHFTSQSALFAVKSGTMLLRKQSNFDLPGDLEFPVSSAPAFANAIETKDSVVALRLRSEVTEHLSLESTGARARLFPILNGGRVVAVAFAVDGEGTDVNGLEIVVGIASAVLERQGNREAQGLIAPASVPPPPSPGEKPAGRSLPKWSELDEKGQLLHVRAQRFARVTVAEMQLSRPEACRAGREKSNLYLFLKSEIETARHLYRQQFMTIPSMVDYLHLELVRTAAEGDEERLGAEYPGQLI